MLYIGDTATMGTASFDVGANAGINTFSSSSLKLSGVTITGTGVISLSIVTTTDASHIASSLDVMGCVQDTSVDISANSTLSTVDYYTVDNGLTLTLTASQLTALDFGVLSDGNLVVQDIGASSDLSKIHVTGTVTGTVNASVDLSSVDLTNLTALTIGADGGDAISVTVSPAQYAAWHSSATIGDNDALVSSDSTAPTATIASAAYYENVNRLVLAGANFSTLLESGETSATDIKDRLDWSKLSWDITLDAATATAAISISNKPTSGSAGAMTVTGGSGDDSFTFGDGTARVNFAATAAANGNDSINVAAANVGVTLDFSAFLSTVNADTTAVDFVTAGLDLSTNNLGIVFNKASLTGGDIATSAAANAVAVAANAVAVADNGKAVVFCASAADASTAAAAWNIYFIEDTDNSGSQIWSVTLVGQVVADGSGATATEIGTLTFT